MISSSNCFHRISVLLILLGCLLLFSRNSLGQSRSKGDVLELYINQELMRPKDTIKYEWVQAADSVFQISYKIPEALLPGLRKKEAIFTFYIVRQGSSLRQFNWSVSKQEESYNAYRYLKIMQKGDILAVEFPPSRYYAQFVVD